MPDLTRLQRIIRLAYEMQDTDQDRLERDIVEHHKRDWRSALEEEAQRLGRQRSANDPRKGDLAYFRDLARQDATSITKTYNRDLESEIRRLFDENPRGNRNYYRANLEDWYQKRAAWKDRQIALMNRQNARAYAKERFYQENGLRGGTWYYEGPAPVSDACKERMAAGVVNQQYVDRNPTPAHIGCPHEWAPANAPLPDNYRLWMG